MTRFEKYTSDVEMLAELIEMATNLDLGQLYCKNHVKCNELLDTEDGIPTSECRKCLIDWLSQEEQNENKE